MADQQSASLSSYERYTFCADICFKLTVAECCRRKFARSKIAKRVWAARSVLALQGLRALARLRQVFETSSVCALSSVVSH